jgi:hypothetical protein
VIVSFNMIEYSSGIAAADGRTKVLKPGEVEGERLHGTPPRFLDKSARCAGTWHTTTPNNWTK